MSNTTVTAEELGNVTTGLDAAAYRAAAAYLDEDLAGWLWNEGDFYNRLYETCQRIAADHNSRHVTPAMRQTAAEFCRYYETA